MSASFEFEWDGAKAIFNLRKHGVDFDEAMGVFLDPLAMTRYDDEHSESETRWVTLGRSPAGMLLVVVHTFSESGPDSALVRLISARPATRQEHRQYEEG